MEVLSNDEALDRVARTTDLVGVVLGDADLAGRDITDRRFQTVVFTGVQLAESRVTGCVFGECSFTGGGLAGAAVAVSRFHRTNFADVSLANATVRFTPAGPGRTSEGITDADGRYELRYLRDIPGANIDQHIVRITTASEANGGRELLPPPYHARSQLEARVVPGKNDHDFDLRSQGP